MIESCNGICFCIPARYASSRLSNKLLLKLNQDSCIKRTIKQVSKSKFFNNNIYVLTDEQIIVDEVKTLNCHTILTNGYYCNGTERISKNLKSIPCHYNIIVNIQADEPFISPLNIDESISKHLQHRHTDIYYTTLHEENNDINYLKSTASLKLITDNRNNVLYYSRNIIPWNKSNSINSNYKYKTFTGIYVFNRDKIEMYSSISNTSLQNEEDCEQLKILEHGFIIKTYPTIEYNEISLNTKEDYEYLYNKYLNNNS